MATTDPVGIADLGPLERAKEQKAWYWYDWANSAYVTTIGTVMFGPYFIGLAQNAAGPGARPGPVRPTGPPPPSRRSRYRRRSATAAWR